MEPSAEEHFQALNRRLDKLMSLVQWQLSLLAFIALVLGGARFGWWSL